MVHDIYDHTLSEGVYEGKVNKVQTKLKHLLFADTEDTSY